MEKGFISFVLHAHLPYVRHPEHDYFLEENWFYEAITETYLPLIHMFEGFERDRVPCRMTMTLSPSLLCMLRDGLLQERYVRHITKLIELAAKEVERTRAQPEFNETAHHYLEDFTRARDTFCRRYQCDITQAFRHFQEAGLLDIITCGATHGFLPLLNPSERAVSAQIETAVRHYESVLGRRPQGIWLPECGYYPGVDRLLKQNGIRFFITDTHGILHASPRPKFGVFAPIYCPTGVAAFGRDVESSKQVWSAVEGYPGDFDYREYYRDIGFDLDYETIRPYIAADGLRINTGIKYYRITGKSDHKAPYVRAQALEKAASHAANFMFNRQKQVEYLHDFMGRKPVILSPYDAELFGHWWYEGPQFLNFFVRKVAYDQETLRLITPMDYLSQYPVNQVSTPSLSSWGWRGYSETWLSGSNDWIYRHLHKAAVRMAELTDRYQGCYGLTERALNQAAREIFLAQSSDWAFILHTGTMVPYAIKRTQEHVLNFTRIYEDLLANRIDEGWLHQLEEKDKIFPDADYRVFGTPS